MGERSKFELIEIPAFGRATSLNDKNREADFVKDLNREIALGISKQFRDLTFALDKFCHNASVQTKTWHTSTEDMTNAMIWVVGLLLPQAAGVAKKFAERLLKPQLGEYKLTSITEAIGTAFSEAGNKVKAAPKPTDWDGVIYKITTPLKTQFMVKEKKLLGGQGAYLIIKKERPKRFNKLFEIYASKGILGAGFHQCFKTAIKDSGYPTNTQTYGMEMLAKMIEELEMYRLKSGYNISNSDIANGGPTWAKSYGQRMAKIAYGLKSKKNF